MAPSYSAWCQRHLASPSCVYFHHENRISGPLANVKRGTGPPFSVEDPSFGNIAGVAQPRGAKVRHFPLHMERGWKAYEQFVRIGFGCRTEQFEDGLTTLMQALQG